MPEARLFILVFRLLTSANKIVRQVIHSVQVVHKHKIVKFRILFCLNQNLVRSWSIFEKNFESFYLIFATISNFERD